MKSDEVRFKLVERSKKAGESASWRLKFGKNALKNKKKPIPIRNRLFNANEKRSNSQTDLHNNVP